MCKAVGIPVNRDVTISPFLNELSFLFDCELSRIFFYFFPPFLCRIYSPGNPEPTCFDFIEDRMNIF